MIFSLFLFWCNKSILTSKANNSWLNESIDTGIKEIKEKEEEILEDSIDEDLDDMVLVKEDTNEDIGLSWKNMNEKNTSQMITVDFDTLHSPKDCLKYKMSLNKKRECISYVENKILNDIPSIENCKKLIFKKDKLKCLDNMYFILAKKNKKKKYCNFIKNTSVKSVCIRDIDNYMRTLSLQKKRDAKKKRINDVYVNSTNDCASLKWEKKANCLIELVKKEKDLRYCADLTWNLKNKCINDNWNELLKYNLLQAIKTKDSIYCKKIYKKTWVDKCLAKIK